MPRRRAGPLMPHPFDHDSIPSLANLDVHELRNLLDRSTEGTWYFEPDEDRVLWSPRVFEFLRYHEPRERFQDIDEIIHPDDRDDHRRAVENVLAAGGQYCIVVRIRCGDGSYKGISVHGFLLPPREGAGRRLVGFLLDATAELEAKESLRRSEARFRAFMDNCPAAVFLKDDEGRHIYANETAANIAGVTVERMVGHTMAEIFEQASAESMFAADREARDADRPITKIEHVVNAEGEARHVLDTKFPVPDIASDTTLVGGFGLDITDRVQQEEEIRNLDRRVQDAQRLESIGMLAGGVAHDFNNVLTTVVGNVELAMDEDDSAKRERNLRAALDRCKQAAALCSQLLTYAGRSPFSPRAIQPARLLESAGELLDVSRSSGARLEIDVEAGLPDIHADEIQVRQVLLNLITNAVHATSKRADRVIQLSCHRCSSRGGHAVNHSWTRTEDQPAVCFIVRDNGAGMTQDQLQRIFEPFYTTKKDGRGLGMPTVLGIIKSHAGSIGIDSTVDLGSEVTVCFPLAPAGQTRKNSGSGSGDEPLDLTGKHILVVDDQPEIRSVASSLIERLGASVHRASSGREALDLLASGAAVDLALVDVTMPNMGGTELAAHIRERYSAVGIVLTSGYTATDESAKTEHVFLHKPYRVSTLQSALREGLEQADG